MSVRKLRPMLIEVSAELTRIKDRNAQLEQQIESYRVENQGMRRRIKSLTNNKHHGIT